MSETRTYNPDGSLARLDIDNRDHLLVLQLEELQRQIPIEAVRIIYQELDETDTLLTTIDKTREQLLNMLETYNYRIDFTYYPTGEIDTIRIRTFNAMVTKIDDKTLKHYIDGRQPEYV